ncbi:MAG: carbamoyltransferase C-terminal domain-containing protein [Chloroflexota bacterium]|jgi:carbamoyltransferase|nr:carbamoyltransferase C-terminal domain-containing protein [Chloroflexota bacterium]MDP6507419.1 carbamoyltransferase C-terminal domain-containing protein [Chloroflexota bacterium]MDP6758139.1 carbamoyltransferase C-terminal domain-containing protein [Chloroflexota bacterium]
MEYGSRSLGSRSILAAPTDVSINDWLNEKLQRTEFMPFAPAVLDQAAGEIFVDYQPGAFAAEYMTVTFDVDPAWRARIPAVVHVDGTARPQVVESTTSPAYYRVIEQYERRTGLPVVLNTSFNVHEEPIVESPAEALRAFVSSRLDAVVMGGVVVSRDAAVLEHARAREVVALA